MEEIVYHFGIHSQQSRCCNLEICGISFCDGSYFISRGADSPTFVFEYVRKGRGFLQVNDTLCYPQGGDLYIAPGNTSHSYGSSADDPWEKVWVNLSGTLPAALLDAYELREVFLIPNCPVESFFNEIISLVQSDAPNLVEKVELLLQQIIQAAAKVYHKPKDSGRTGEAIILKTYLDENFCNAISLEDLGRLIHKSPAQVLRIFRKEWQTTPYQYLLDLRLHLAARFLCNTCKNIKDIARESGFCDEYYFSSLFKKKIGVSPKNYRRKFQR